MLATTLAWLKAAFPFGPTPHLALTATQRPGALRFAAIIVAILALDVALKVGVLARLASDPVSSALRASKTFS
jgi:hypothetical protein